MWPAPPPTSQTRASSAGGAQSTRSDPAISAEKLRMAPSNWAICAARPGSPCQAQNSSPKASLKPDRPDERLLVPAALHASLVSSLIINTNGRTLAGWSERSMSPAGVSEYLPCASVLRSLMPSPARIIRQRKPGTSSSFAAASSQATPPPAPTASMAPLLVSEYEISDCQYAVARVFTWTGGGRVATAAASKNSFIATATRNTGHGGSMPVGLPGGVVGGVTPAGDVPTR
mmetsp:Transcript_19656/g.58461  ORF Transcript_19656/g.58461 Transcript_19656/m.58461 type:complete len:231 (-) Transcript_19656:177-869(-)